jgi:tRNA(adenine34) deaminase
MNEQLAPVRAAAQERDIAMMRQALRLAEQAAAIGEVPIGAVVYRGEEVLAQAHNRRELDADPTAHAEILVLRQAAAKVGVWRLDGCSIAVTLEPCPMCAGALVNSRLQRLVYGAADAKMGCVDTLHRLCDDARFNHRLVVIPGVLADESAALLQAFFRARRGADKPAKPRPANASGENH